MSCRYIIDLPIDIFNILITDFFIQVKLRKTSKFFFYNINVIIFGPYTTMLKNALMSYNLQTNNCNILKFFQKMDQLDNNFYVFHSDDIFYSYDSLGTKHNTFYIDCVSNFSINILFTYHEHNQDLIYLSNNKSCIFLHNVLNISKNINNVSTYLYNKKQYIVDQFQYMHLI